MVNSKTGEIVLDGKDRIISLPYFKEKKINCFSFFWKGKDLIFSNIYTKEGHYYIFNSWTGKSEAIEGDSFEIQQEIFLRAQNSFDSIGRKVLNKNLNLNNKSHDFLNFYFDAKESSFFKKNKNKKLKFLERKSEKIGNDIKKLTGLCEIEEDLKNLKISLDNKNSYTLCNKKIKFEKEWSMFKKRDILFGKIKKFKIGLQILKKRKDDCETEIKDIFSKKNVNDIKISNVKIIKPFWKYESGKIKKVSINKSRGFDEYILDNKYKLGIGLNSQGNDNLRKSFGRKNDLWFHAESYKSCHCIIKAEKFSDISEAYFEAIGSIIRDKSNLEIEIIPLVFTQVKNIKGLKGKPGAVTLKKEKYRDVKYNSNWREIISKN